MSSENNVTFYERCPIFNLGFLDNIPTVGSRRSNVCELPDLMYWKSCPMFSLDGSGYTQVSREEIERICQPDTQTNAPSA
jgi:hypothetical protein